MKTIIMKTNGSFLYFSLLLFVSVIIGCEKNSNRVYFSINPEDRKMLLPVQLDDSITANLVFDTGYFLVLDSVFCAAHPSLSLYTGADTAQQTIAGVSWASSVTPGLWYETSRQATRIGNVDFVYSHILVYNLKKYMGNDKLDGVFHIPPDDTTHIWELNFEYNYLEVHSAIDFRMPENCFLLPMVEEGYWKKNGSSNVITIKLPMRITSADGDTTTINRTYMIDTGMPWDIALMRTTEEQAFFNNKPDAVWTQDGRSYFRHHTVKATLFDNFVTDSLRIYLFDRPMGIDGQYLIGQNFLKRFNVYFDMKNRQVGLQPITFHRIIDPLYRRFHYSTSQTPEGKFVVNKVADYQGNYYQTAGLREGDEIIAVNGLPYGNYSRSFLPVDSLVIGLRHNTIRMEDWRIFRTDTLAFDIVRNKEPITIIVVADKNEASGD